MQLGGLGGSGLASLEKGTCVVHAGEGRRPPSLLLKREVMYKSTKRGPKLNYLLCLTASKLQNVPLGGSSPSPQL